MEGQIVVADDGKMLSGCRTACGVSCLVALFLQPGYPCERTELAALYADAAAQVIHSCDKHFSDLLKDRGSHFNCLEDLRTSGCY